MSENVNRPTPFDNSTGFQNQDLVGDNPGTQKVMRDVKQAEPLFFPERRK
jgi:hypothetical protein